MIRKTPSDFNVDAMPGKSVWNKADAAPIASYVWARPADPPRPDAEARLLYTSTQLYVRFEVRSPTVIARALKPNELVCLDSCVEFFVAPDGINYLNFETNCVGTLLLWIGPDRNNRRIVDLADAAMVKIATTLPRGSAIPEATPAPGDGWRVEYSIPFDLLAKYTGRPAPESGTIWRANFYYCADNLPPAPQWGSWNPVNCPAPDFHRPEYFGELQFE